MIVTAFVTGNTGKDQWQAELLEYSWHNCGQPGELVRLTATSHDRPLPRHTFARVIPTFPWENHPYLPDIYPGYNLPASVLEWLVTTRLEATILLLEADCILIEPISREVVPGGALADHWHDLPTGEGPFHLPQQYLDLQAFCVNRTLATPEARLPLLIHSSDLLKLAARWLELIAILRNDACPAAGPPRDAVYIAYNIAAAEYGIRNQTRKFSSASHESEADSPVLGYRRPITTSDGRILFNPESYQPGSLVQPDKAGNGAGQRFLSYLSDYNGARQSGSHLRHLKPVRRPGVREARVYNQTLIEVPSRATVLALNPSASSIWQLCDGRNSLADIVTEIKNTFEVASDTIASDVEQAVMQLQLDQAISLERIPA